MYICVREDNDTGAIRLSVLGRQPHEGHRTGGERRDHLRGYAAFWLTHHSFERGDYIVV